MNLRQSSLFSAFFAATALLAGSAAYLIGLLASSRKSAESKEKKEPLLSGREVEAAPHADEGLGDQQLVEDKEELEEQEEPEEPPVDEYLELLVEQELGAPRFAVQKTVEREASLKRLLDEEWGPPRFAVPKQPQAMEVEQDEGTSYEAAIAHQLAPKEKQVMKLTVIAGPCTGTSYDSSSGPLEIVIGRVPASTFPIPDQEISSKHAVIHYVAPEDCWKITDLGSMNGSLLNGTVVSTPNRQPGQSHKLSDGDLLELGGLTKIKVSCGPSSPSKPPSSKKPRHLNAAALPPQLLLSNAPVSNGTWGPSSNAVKPMSYASRSISNTMVKLPSPVLTTDLTFRGLEGVKHHLVLHQRLGTEHLRTGTSIEDVALHQIPFPSPSESSDANGPSSSPSSLLASGNDGLLCIFDGHQGTQAADKAKLIVPRLLAAKLLPPPSLLPSAAMNGLILSRGQDEQEKLLTEVFLEADKEISSDEGCTATVVLLQSATPPSSSSSRPSLYVQAANVGDSSVVVIDLTAGTHVKLTEDHRIANNAKERQRLQGLGHTTVKKRLFGINISRMLGDKFLKDELPGSFLAEPHVSPSVEIPADHVAFILMASDGLWDVLPEDKAGAMVLRAYSEDPVGTNAELIADMMLSQALALRSTDDITIKVLAKPKYV